MSQVIPDVVWKPDLWTLPGVPRGVYSCEDEKLIFLACVYHYKKNYCTFLWLCLFGLDVKIVSTLWSRLTFIKWFSSYTDWPLKATFNRFIYLTSIATLGPLINLTSMFVDCGRKLRNLERTHVGRTCNLHRKASAQVWSWSLLAVRQRPLSVKYKATVQEYVYLSS